MIDALEQRIQNGFEAGDILASTVYQEAFAEIEKEYTAAWMNSPARDVGAREKLYLMLRLLKKVQGHLELKMTDGKIAQMTLDDRTRAQKAVDRMKDWTGF